MAPLKGLFQEYSHDLLRFYLTLVKILGEVSLFDWGFRANFIDVVLNGVGLDNRSPFFQEPKKNTELPPWIRGPEIVNNEQKLHYQERKKRENGNWTASKFIRTMISDPNTDSERHKTGHQNYQNLLLVVGSLFPFLACDEFHFGLARDQSSDREARGERRISGTNID